jgi:hypothetical protein
MAIKTCNEGWHMNCLKNFYIQQYQLQGSSINESNPLFAPFHDPSAQQAIAQMLQSTKATPQNTHSAHYMT